MIDINLLRETPEIVKDSQRRRKADESVVGQVLKLDEAWRSLLQKTEDLKRQRNEASQAIIKLKKEKQNAAAKIKETQKLGKEIEANDFKTQEKQAERDLLLKRIPNLLHESVPQGDDDTENVLVRDWGKKPKFSFEAKNHIDLMEQHDLVDLERAAKTSGSRFFFLKNELAILDLALQQYALEFLRKNKFTVVEPPFMIKREPYEGVTDMQFFEEQLYKIEGEDLYLIATSEHAIGAMYMNELLTEDQVPLRVAGLSACFRKEAGSHGKDTKGIFRVHQFNKIEQFIFCKPENSWTYFDELIGNAEKLFQGLELPYRVVNICTGDLGDIAAKKYDLEVWLPAQSQYREAVSCSNCTDYQARRLNIKVGKAGGDKRLVHTLNSTAIATSRALVAILENFQQADGSVKIPKVLHKYTGFKEITAKK